MSADLPALPSVQREAECPFGVGRLRLDFPILTRKVHGKRLVYLDNAATTQKPEAVIRALVNFYENHNANVHRGAHSLAEEATDAYEEARRTVAKFIGVEEPQRIVFTRNTTESINFLAYAWAWERLRPGNVILTTTMEHHSNMVPWQMIAQRTGAQVRYIPVLPDGTLDFDAFHSLLTPDVKLFAVAHASNVVGTINPVAEMIADLRRVSREAVAVIDATQTVPQMPVAFEELGADALVFTGHKTYGPLGVGVLALSARLADEMGPFLGGGSMIERVTLLETTFAAAPARFEAGTPNVADAVGLATALDYLQKIGPAAVRRHGRCLTEYALARLAEFPHLRILGPTDPARRVSLVAFVDPEIHAHDLATIIDRQGVAIRAGHHCAQPLAQALGVTASARVSFGLYNTKREVDLFIAALVQAREYFGHVV